jgi:hypothetical protein
MTRTDLASLLINTLMDNELERQRLRNGSQRPVRHLSVVPPLVDDADES